MEEISIKEYLGVILKRKWLIIIITILATVTSFVVSKFIMKPTYSATATMIVGNNKMDETKKQVDINDLMAYDKLVSTYAQVLKSRVVLKDAASKLNFKIKPDEILSVLSVTPQQDTQIIEIQAKSKDPKKAAKIANQVSISFIKKITSIMKMEQNVHMVDMAEISKSPVSPKIPLNTAIAMFGGLMLSVFIAFFLEYLDDTIKTPDDINKYLELPVIGTIPYLDEEQLAGKNGGKVKK